MRQLRPEYYSDTRSRAAYNLSQTTLEYYLDSITSRNETHDFEVFCRKLCERTICPNLRPQTGPEGGGDSKADTETFPVSNEIASLTYVGEANAGNERWAFAFSAKKKWSTKVRDDVKGICETKRNYDRIICVTSRFARAKDRARIEDELTKQYGIPVVIHDRSWIVKEVIENERTDLAFNYLKIGTDSPDSSKLGPTDYSRTQQLQDIELAVEDATAFDGMEHQRATEALVAAKLSRNLERPRVETDGRFVRAIRLADANGSYRQKLEARYEQIWTAFWWFDDIDFVLKEYEDFESFALKSNHAKNLDFLGNLYQLLINCVVCRHRSAEECRLNERKDKLTSALEAIAHDPSRPNNSLEAQSDLLRIQLNSAMLVRDQEALSSVWDGYRSVLEKASGLGEFDADGLSAFIEQVGQIAGNDPAYNLLVEKLADFISERKSEGEGALILLRRAQKLELEDHFDMIRWLGKAIIGLTKREYLAEQIEAAQLLSIAYRSAGLPWASRATSVFACASLIIEGETKSELDVGIVPTMNLWAWNALSLGHLPDFLVAVQFLRGFLVGLPLDEESKDRLRNQLSQFDAALACLLLNLDEANLRQLENVPDILAGLELFVARTALLYLLGYEDMLREDGSLPAEETALEVQQLLSLLKGQPNTEGYGEFLILNAGNQQKFETSILGMKIEVEFNERGAITVAETTLGCLEAFFATVIDTSAAAHTEFFQISVHLSEDVNKPSIHIDELEMSAIIYWPRGISVAQFDQQELVNEFFVEVAAKIMCATCIVQDTKAWLEKLCKDEAMLQRIMMICVASNSYTRTTSQSFTCLADWNSAISRSYPLKGSPRQIDTIQPEDLSAPENEDIPDNDISVIRSHRQVRVSSVIDIHAWNQAGWRGCGYMGLRPDYPPVLLLLFENEEAGRKIFERWRSRFGEEDADNEIVMSIIRRLPDSNPHHYCVMVSSKTPPKDDGRHLVSMPTRSQTMEPDDSKNLEWFLTSYQQTGAYYIVPATGLGGGQIFSDLAILKRDLRIRSAKEVGDSDVEALALRIRGMEPAT